jgi:hypothetical protein
LAREENSSDIDSNHSENGEERKLATEEHDGKAHGSEKTSMDVNMLFMIPAEFWAPEENVVELVLGIERAVFEKPKNAGEHMKSLFIKRHLDGKPIGRMMVDEGASVKIMPLTVFREPWTSTCYL